MTAAPAKSPPTPDPVATLFAIRVSELAERVSQGGLPFIEAVDMAYSAAQWSGLADEIGDDAVQKILAAAFGRVGRGDT